MTYHAVTDFAASLESEVSRGAQRASLLPYGLSVAACALMALGVPSTGFAQTADLDADYDGDEIIVTARKREETLQEVPIAITAFTEAQIEKLNIRDITDAALFTPGLAMQNISGGVEQPFIRGASSTSFARTEQTTSTFQDGAFSSTLGRTVFPGDIARLEVIKGPQAALFGRATFAGAVNYITRQPTAEQAGEIRATVGENGRFDGHISSSGPIVEDVLLYRVSANTEQFGGEYESTLDGRELGILNRSGVSGWLTFTPTESFEARLRGSFYKREDNRQVPGYIQPAALFNNCFPNAAGVNQYFCGTIDPDPAFLGLNLDRVNDGFSDSEQRRGQLEMDWQVGDFTISSQTLIVEEEGATQFDGDYTPFPAFGTLVASTNDNFSQELRIASPADERLRYLAGVFYFEEDSSSALGAFGTSFSDVETYAAFASVSYDFTEALTLSVDARLQSEEQQLVDRAGNVFEATTDSFLPRAILEFEASDTTNLYASVSKGTNPARFNTSSNVPTEFITIDEEEMWSYEAGLKWASQDGRATFNAAGFFIDWSNQATRFETVGLDGTIINFLANIGGTEIFGAEFDGTYEVSDNFDLIATLSYNNAEYTEFQSNNALRVLGNADVSGNSLPNTPDWTGTIAGEYSAPFALVPETDYFLRGEYSYRGKQYISEINRAQISDLNLVNLRAGVESDRVRLEFGVLNLLDDDSPEFATRFTDFGGGFFGSRFAPLVRLREGRRAEIRVRYRY
ncbi:MAG: TonB-dependent receptor [Pseudomonadota bacterium]